MCKNTDCPDVANRPPRIEDLDYALWLSQCNDLITQSLDLSKIRNARGYDTAREELMGDPKRWPATAGATAAASFYSPQFPRLVAVFNEREPKSNRCPAWDQVPDDLYMSDVFRAVVLRRASQFREGIMKHAKCENREQYVHNVLALAMIRLCRHVIGRAEVMRQHCLSNTKVKEAEWTWLYRCLRGNGREVQRGIIVDLRPPGIGNGRVLNETDLPQDGQSVLGKAVDGHESPDVTASKHEQARSLRERLQRLPEQERMVIMLSYYEEHSDEEVSKITGLPVADVKVILRRAIRLLRADAS